MRYRQNYETKLTIQQLASVSDEELMFHLQNGHDDALAVLFERYQRLVFSIASRIVRDASEAEDVMQAVFLEVYRAAHQFDSLKGSAKGWILQYAYHRASNRRRDLARRSYYIQASTEFNGGLAITPPCGSLETTERAVLIHEVLAMLSGRQKQVLEMAYFEGMKMAEIAERIGESVGNVRNHFYRGLNQLRLCLEVEGTNARGPAGEAARAGA